jgi:hypothetical protein
LPATLARRASDFLRVVDLEAHDTAQPFAGSLRNELVGRERATNESQGQGPQPTRHGARV